MKDMKWVWKRLMLTMVLVVFIVAAAGYATAASSTTSTSPTNMVVDFDSTTFDSSLRQGDSGVLNLVIKNTGGSRAENVEVWIPSTAVIQANKRFYVGTIEASTSKTIPVILRVEGQAKTGLTAVQVRINYDGVNSLGNKENNQLTTWEIPVRVYGDPLFQITPSKTTYFKDTLGELNLLGLARDPVKNLEATLSSSCATIIGSSRKYVGNVGANQTFKLAYEIKPTSSGACSTSLRLSYTDESGTKVSDNVSIGLNVEEAGVDFKVTNISYGPTGPGETVSVKIVLMNVGHADSDDTTLSLSLSSPFAPVDTPEKYVGKVPGVQTVDAEFKLAVGWDAETKTYSIPLNITYKVGGTSYSVKKDIGVDVSGKVILEIINVESSRGTVRVDVANIGTRTADGVKATLVAADVGEQQQFGGAFSRNRTRTANDSETQQTPPEGEFPRNMTRPANMTQTGEAQYSVSYKSDIKPNKQTTFTFSTQAQGTAILTLEYTGPNNERVTHTERITLPRSTDSTGVGSTALRTNIQGGTSMTQYAVYGLIALIAVFAAYKLYGRMKSK